MAWWSVFGVGRRRILMPSPSMTARTETFAAEVIPRPDPKILPTVSSWQEEAWRFYQDLGEAGYAADWLSNMVSRVRLRAARLNPALDEPEIADSGPAVDVVALLGGGITGQTQLLASLAVQMSVPGEGFLLGEAVNGRELWTVRSTDEIRVRNGAYEVVDSRVNGKEVWRQTGPGALVVRVWNPDKRYYHAATSPFRSALAALRELELVNRHITSQYLSRLASAGVVVFPEEVTFPVREEFEDETDPFMAEWIEIAATAIKNPGTASALVPIPIRVPGEYVDKVKHVDFTLELDAEIIGKRDAAIKRVATRMNVPAEVLLGMGDVNHWGAWQLEEGALKANVAPLVELICHNLTTGYLWPRLEASGVPAAELGQWVVWYDMSELTLRPDRSANAVQAYDRMELSGDALRRELGFDDSDRPTDEDLREQALRKLLAQPASALTAYAELTGDRVETASPAPTGSAAPDGETAPVPAQTGPPDQENAQTALSRRSWEAQEMRRERLARQAKARHALRFARGGSWELLHPPTCSGHLYSCPFTHATWNLSDKARPGTSGVYECRLDVFGLPVIGSYSPTLDVSTFLTTRGADYVRA